MVRATDPLSGSARDAPGTVAGFIQSPLNTALMTFADRERSRRGYTRALDTACGAGRHGVPLVRSSWQVLGIDRLRPRLSAGPSAHGTTALATAPLVLAPMDACPVRGASVDLVVAHGLWNLARSAAEFRRTVREAARVATVGTGLFLLANSRAALPPNADAVLVRRSCSPGRERKR